MAKHYFFYCLIFFLLFNLNVNAQDVSISPTELHVSLLLGEAAEESLTLTNNSQKELIWRPNTDAFYLRFDRLNDEYPTILSKLPDYYTFAYDGRDFFIQDGGNNMYDGGNVISTNLGGQVQYSDSLIRSAPIFGPGSRYYTRHLPGLFVLAVDQPSITNFLIGGNLGADQQGEADVATIDTVLNDTPYRFFIKRVYNAGVPSVNHLIIVENPANAFHSYSLVTETDYHEVKQLENATSIHYLLFAGKEGRYYGNDAVKEVAGSYLAMHEVQSLPGWLKADTYYSFPDTLLPGESLNYSLGIEPGDLGPGNYSGLLNFRTNDPDFRNLEIPVHLQYNNVLVSKPLTDTLLNEGFAELAISLDGVFNARQDASLTYSSQVEQEGVVVARIENQQLVLEERGLGSSRISVQATDSEGYTSSSSFILRVNDVPDLLVQLPDTTVSPLFDDYVIDLDTVFYDSDAEQLQYSISSSNEAVATVGLEGTILRIMNQGEGQSQISITADDGEGGTTSTHFMYTGDYTAGITELKALGISIYPNPMQREVNIRWQFGLPIQQISLRNLQGSILFDYQPAQDQKQLQIPASALPAGLYLLSIQTRDKRHVVRVVKP